MNYTYRIAQYKTSQNYDELFDLVKKQSIICVVDFSINNRDVAHTIYSHDEEIIQVSARGICYLWATNKDDFISECKKINLEWLHP